MIMTVTFSMKSFSWHESRAYSHVSPKIDTIGLLANAYFRLNSHDVTVLAYFMYLSKWSSLHGVL